MTARVDNHALGRSGRRKACDLCFTKKIKCDMLQPTCSNCILYKAECTTGKGRRKPNPPARVRAAAIQHHQQPQYTTANTEKTEDRLARIEKQLEQLIAMQASRPADTTGSWSSSQCEQGGDSAMTLSNTDFDVAFPSRDPVVFDSASTKFPLAMDLAPRDELPLPPQADIMPIVDHYFDTYAYIMPLFDQKSFMSMLYQWYTDPSTRNKASWAAIQVVLAIALRTPIPELLNGCGGSDRHHRANFFLKNAQSVVSDLVTRDKDLLGLQVLLGIVMLFQNSSDTSPASVIIGTAIRLAHRMRLHSRDHAELFSPDENLQRQRLFWIAYVLDKDISLRIQVPSVQLDSDIDIDVPPVKPADDVGVLWTSDGQTCFNHHRSMIHLAQIQGRVYDWLHSNSSAKMSRQSRQQRVQQLDRMITHWYSTIPAAFNLENLDASIGECALIHMAKMYHVYLLILVMTYGIYNQDSNWVQAIRSGDRNAIRNLVLGTERYDSGAASQKQVRLLPGSWHKVVQVSRGCLRLFDMCIPTECLIWQCSCPHFSGMMVLLANLLIEPTHADAVSDEILSARAIQLFDKVLELIPDPEHYTDIRVIIEELYNRAVLVINEAKSQGGDDQVDVLEANLLSYETLDGDPWSWAAALPGRTDFSADTRDGDGDSLGVLPLCR
ncbi:Zn(2)-Cys(6) zinc finger domain protein [Metarhizium robertsii]|uniref:Zn(2)-C6 fungal-type DNA-binding domain protein n=2 Tax=Metarhizium robertsii TaxID=568076 RepID=E9FCL3_METRA|nr:Zn(2)-C6 fungal-type DNA-binding domain protein [Metarhizium robertsii ARSEF 23]EFY94520.1 Zn(2)-C6 fungal-type DNA-binding domain protein [Metarhizium robertsii ARSEF 23]EXU95564.1 Zn(2)-Cys(6) zinc finger domain protein [Metarhizium robertsii]